MSDAPRESITVEDINGPVQLTIQAKARRGASMGLLQDYFWG